MTHPSFQSILTGFSQDDIETQCAAFQQARDIIQKWADEAVKAMRDGDNRYLIAERLPILGPLCLKPLEELMDGEAENEAKELAALVAYQLGSNRGENLLFEALETVTQYACLAARSLAFKGNKKAVPYLVKGLRSLHFSRDAEMAVYIDALRNLDYDFPHDLIERLTCEEADWKIKARFK